MQRFSIEYKRGRPGGLDVRTYTSTERDALLASLIDGARAFGNVDCYIRMTPTNRGFRVGPLYAPVDEDIETLYLRVGGTGMP